MSISIVTTYTFVTDDGTSYGDTISETIDQGEDASAPLRYQFPIGTTREQFFDVATAAEFASLASSDDLCMMIVNRDDSNACTIYVTDTAGDEFYAVLGPDEWLYFPTSLVAAGTGAAPPLVQITQIDGAFANANGTIEMLAFNNPGKLMPTLTITKTITYTDDDSGVSFGITSTKSKKGTHAYRQVLSAADATTIAILNIAGDPSYSKIHAAVFENVGDWGSYIVISSGGQVVYIPLPPGRTFDLFNSNFWNQDSATDPDTIDSISIEGNGGTCKIKLDAILS